MKEIPLTQGMTAIVDDEDYEALIEWKWYYDIGYAVRSGRKQEYGQDGKRGLILMHRVILNTPRGYETDHINGNGLDNRKENLRIATRSQNVCNKGNPKNNTSGFKGIVWHKRDKKWQGQITLNNKRIHLGYFGDKLEAAIAYNKAATKYHGEFACLNEIIGMGRPKKEKEVADVDPL